MKSELISPHLLSNCTQRKDSASIQDETAAALLRFLQEVLMTRFPAFPDVFAKLIPAACTELTHALGTDGRCLYFHPKLLLQEFSKNASALKRQYLHAVLHGICFHMVQRSEVSAPGHTAQTTASESHCTYAFYESAPHWDWAKQRWDAACDLSALLLEHQLGNDPEVKALADEICRFLTVCLEQRQNCLLIQPNLLSASDCETDTIPKKSADYFRTIQRCLSRRAYLHPKQILFLLDSDQMRDPVFQDLCRRCALDSHQFWFRDLIDTDSRSIGSDSSHAVSSPAHRGAHLNAQQLAFLESLQEMWANRLPDLQAAAQTGTHQGHHGTLSEEAQLKKREETDYRKFLRQFAVPREEALLDMESFDYIPYHYGLTYYKNMPFLEPLEYSEVNRLDELAIAIDTSGSCSGRLVRRFLEETWTILSQRENFFSKMRLHLIQCDCMVQEHRIFTSAEEWEAAIPSLQIHGHGDTDFCPVFTYLEKLLEQKEIRHLRGLLYFSDGDGIFPTKAPTWDTAFVFLNEQTEKQKLPDWAIRLNLHLPEEFDTQFSETFDH